MFLHVSVILSTGGLWQVDTSWQAGRHPWQADPWQADPPPPGKHPPPLKGQPLQRTVRILLECILVLYSSIQ